VQVIAAGPGLAAAADGTGETILTLPAGARARPLAAGGAAALFASLACWTPVAIMADVLLADEEQPERSRRRAAAQALPPLEELLLESWPGPFGCIVIAEPIAAVQLREMAGGVALAQLSAQRMDSPRAQLEARRAGGRHAELRRALTTGLWDIWVLAGQAGWDLVTGEPAVAGAGYPGLADLEAAAMTVVEEIGDGREIADNVRGFAQVRIGSLRLGTAGRFLGGGCPLDFGRLLAGNVVLEIEDCGDDRDKAFLTGAVLLRLAEFLRMRQRPPTHGNRPAEN
jgi:hypothetical protein